MTRERRIRVTLHRVTVAAPSGPRRTIGRAADYGERRALIELFQRYIPDVADNAVPREYNDHLWNPTVLVAEVAGEIVGGLLTCRSPLSADLILAYGAAGRSHPYVANADRVWLLDLLAVD